MKDGNLRMVRAHMGVICMDGKVEMWVCEVGSEQGREERTGRFLGEQEVQVEEEPARRWEDPCRGGHRDKRTWWGWERNLASLAAVCSPQVVCSI